MANEQNLKPFKKNDPRINRKGRPKTFSKLRKLAQQIAHEEAMSKAGKPVVVDQRKITVVENILREWANNPKMQQVFIEYAFGKVPTQTDITSDGEKMETAVTYIVENRNA